MNLKDNLKKIRKDHHLSQEQLADMLGVSRQSVSKWESGTAYPEMDKMLKLCELFDLNIDELLNKDINQVKEEKKSKNNINKFIDDFLLYINKTVNMFINMKVKDKIKCLIEMIVLLFMIVIIFLIFGGICSLLFSNLEQILPDNIYYFIYAIVEGIYGIITFMASIALIFYIFKIRYLDYYEIVDKNNEELDKKVIFSKKEKVIIRDPKHSEYNIISNLLKFLLILVKIFVCFIIINFCFSLIFLVICLILSFIVLKTGLFFLGLILSIISLIIINIIILIILFNFILSKKNKKTLLVIIFISSLILCGMGIGISIFSFKSFNNVNHNDDKYYISEEKTYIMEDISYIHDYGNIHFIESDNSDIKVKITHSKYINIKDNMYNDKSLSFEAYPVDDNYMKVFRKTIDAFNDKFLFDAFDYDILIYTSKDNIEKLKMGMETFNIDDDYEED